MARTAATKLNEVATASVDKVEKSDSTVAVNSGKIEKSTMTVKKDNSFNAIENGEYVLISKKYAGKSLFGTTGKIINFDSDGKAIIGLQEALHFKNIPDFEIKQK